MPQIRVGKQDKQYRELCAVCLEVRVVGLQPRQHVQLLGLLGHRALQTLDSPCILGL